MSYSARLDLAASLEGRTIKGFELGSREYYTRGPLGPLGIPQSPSAQKGRPTTITFETDKGDVVWVVVGDCCSTSWIENAEVEPGLTQTVEHMILGDMPMDGAASTTGGLSHIDYYGVKIITEPATIDGELKLGGHGFIDFRKSSNGCYSGWIEVSSIEDLVKDEEEESEAC